jgi:general secretion pathway protein B
MSYILDALRKSEQQRQATNPDSVTDRILVNQPQHKQRSTKWIIALVISNLLAIGYFAWFFTQKKTQEPPQKIATNPDNQALQPSKPQLPAILAPENNTAQKPNQPLDSQLKPTSPSIAQLIEARKVAEIQQPIKQIPEKKPITTVKKELPKRAGTAPTIRPQPSFPLPEEPAYLPVKKGILAVDDLPYEVRNTLPNLNINVFSYAQQPEDRFVIIDMVKYKTGQHIKGSVLLKEIRPDSIILQYGGNTFRIER